MKTHQIAKQLDNTRITKMMRELKPVKRPIDLSDFDIPIMGDMTGKKVQSFFDNLTTKPCETK